MIQLKIIFVHQVMKKLINHQKFKDVISISKLNKFIDELPQKEETIIGEEAISISGGQKKKELL